jgi:undecaprenyl-diphosphatase
MAELAYAKLEKNVFFQTRSEPIMFEQLNLSLFSFLNAEPTLAGWRLAGAVFAAQWLILLAPLLLVVLWMSGSAVCRQVAVRAALATAGALAINAACGLLWFHPRPFMAGVGHTFLHHAPDSSFPSDHATIMFTVALVCAASQAAGVRRLGRLLLGVALVVAWSRVYLGVHYPLDMAGALVVALLATLLVGTHAAQAACAAIVPVVETVYRRLLAVPITRGWLRP